MIEILTTAKVFAKHMKQKVTNITAFRLLRSWTKVYERRLMGLGRVDSATTNANADIRNKVTVAVVVKVTMMLQWASGPSNWHLNQVELDWFSGLNFDPLLTLKQTLEISFIF
jgi:hypothetical protein